MGMALSLLAKAFCLHPKLERSGGFAADPPKRSRFSPVRCVMALPAEMGDKTNIRLANCNFMVGCESCWFDDEQVEGCATDRSYQRETQERFTSWKGSVRGLCGVSLYVFHRLSSVHQSRFPSNTVLRVTLFRRYVAANATLLMSHGSEWLCMSWPTFLRVRSAPGRTATHPRNTQHTCTLRARD